MGRNALLAITGGSLSGAAVLAAMTGSPLGVILVNLAPLPLMMVGLGLGTGAFGLAAVAGLLLAVGFGGIVGAGLYGGMHVIPSWLVIQQALRPRLSSPDGWQLAGHVSVSITLLVAFVVVATALAGRYDVGLEEQVREVLSSVTQVAAPALDAAQRLAIVDQLAPLFLGFSAVTWVLMLVGNAVAAQVLLAARGWNRRPSPKWSELRLPGWFDWVLVGTALVALGLHGDEGFIARNAVIILLTPYFFVGLAIVHQLAKRAPFPSVMLVAFYLLLFVFFLLAAAVVAALGVIEQWLGVRRRIGLPDCRNGSA